jgi:hypothetical protein
LNPNLRTQEVEPMDNLAFAGTAAYGAARLFLASGWTAAAIRAFAATRGPNRPRVERLADAMAELEAAR